MAIFDRIIEFVPINASMSHGVFCIHMYPFVDGCCMVFCCPLLASAKRHFWHAMMMSLRRYGPICSSIFYKVNVNDTSSLAT